MSSAAFESRSLSGGRGAGRGSNPLANLGGVGAFWFTCCFVGWRVRGEEGFIRTSEIERYFFFFIYMCLTGVFFRLQGW